MATLFSLGCLVSELGVREGIFKKLYQRRPNKNVAGVNYVVVNYGQLQTFRQYSTKQIPSFKLCEKNSSNQPPKGSSHERLDYWNERGYRDKPKTYPSGEPNIINS